MSKSWKTLLAAVVAAGAASSGAIADGYEYEPVTEYAPLPVYSWTGAYAGFSAGWIRLESSAARTGVTGGFVGSPAPGKFSNDSDGFLAGLTLGYNQNLGFSFVGGIENDIAYTDVDATQTKSIVVAGTTVASTTLSREMQWFGTVRARAGWLASRQLLLYATGGLAYANIERRGSATLLAGGITAAGAGSDWKTGWTVGGGGEWLLGNKTTIKAEYLYYDLDDSSFTIVDTVTSSTATYKSENKGHIVRMGLNVALY